MMALDQELVAGGNPFEQSLLRQQAGLACNTPIAISARKHQIPDSIERQRHTKPQQDPWEKVVYIGRSCHGSINGDVGKAIEAFALLVAVQCITASGYRHSSPKIIGGQRLSIVVNSHDQTTWEIQLPRCLHQPPSGFYFLREIAKLNLLTQPEQLVCEPDSGDRKSTRL